jgi:hypothetical protein
MCSICSASTVSARIDPIMKAPSAAEKPVRVASTTIARQSPRETINRVSLFINRFAFFRKNGRMNIPTRNHKIRKKATFRTLIKSSSPTNSLLTAIVERMTIIRIAIRSSTTKVPNTMPVNRWLRKPRSSKALIIIVVDDMDNIPPRNTEFIVLHPNRCPTIKPISNILITSVVAVINAADPTFINFLKLNSSPRAKSKKTTPISAQVLMFSISPTVGKMRT